jgi:hypothetical protein
MSEHKPENDCGLIIDPAVLVDIRTRCQRRGAELEAAKSAAVQAPVLSAPPTPANVPGQSSEQEAERFAAAVEAMPPNVRRFFEREEEATARRVESEEDRTERERRAFLGGWCG